MIAVLSAPGQPHIALAPMTIDAGFTLGHAFATMDPWARYPFTSEGLTGYFNAVEADAPRLTIQRDGELAGAIVVRRTWMRGPYLQFLGLLPKYQSHGIGRLAMTWFEETARARAERNIWVAASDFNHDALRFYEQNGFERAATLDGVAHDNIAEVLLRKRLTYKK